MSHRFRSTQFLSVKLNIFFYSSALTYVLGAQKNHLTEFVKWINLHILSYFDNWNSQYFIQLYTGSYRRCIWKPLYVIVMFYRWSHLTRKKGFWLKHGIGADFIFFMLYLCYRRTVS